jgi:hypothetical protein
MKQPHRFSPSAGIAIGPILFVLALLAILAAVMASGGNDFQTASGADRITADIASQANLIRNTINDCNLQYMLNTSSCTDPGTCTVSTDPYPTSDATNGTTVASLVCSPTTSASLWGAVLLPPPTKGFNAWTYMDASASGGGRCIWTEPDPAVYNSPASSEVVTTGLLRAAQKFNYATSNTGANEVIYDTNGTNNPSQKFIVWITQPTETANGKCSLP